MHRLLQIIATPTPASRSRTRQLADAFLGAWRVAHPGGEVRTIDLSATELPAMDAPMTGVLFGQTDDLPADVAQDRLARLNAVTGPFVSADEYLVVAPMWNFTVPYLLKQYFELIVRPGVTVDITAQGAVGRLAGRRVSVMVTRGADYSPGSPKAVVNYFEPLVRAVFGFMGITEVRFVVAEGQFLPGAEARLTEALRQAARLGSS